jgi:hypothetical protein
MPACSTLATLIIAILGEHLFDTIYRVFGTIYRGARQHHDGYAGIATALMRHTVQ